MKLYDINLWFTENQNKQFESIRYVLQVILLCVLQVKFSVSWHSLYILLQLFKWVMTFFSEAVKYESLSPRQQSRISAAVCHSTWPVLSASSAPVMLSSSFVRSRRLQTSAKPFSCVCPGVTAVEHVGRAAKHCSSSTGYQGILYLVTTIHRPLSLSDDGRKSLALKSLLSGNDKENVTVYQLSCSNCHWALTACKVHCYSNY